MRNYVYFTAFLSFGFVLSSTGSVYSLQSMVSSPNMPSTRQETDPRASTSTSSTYSSEIKKGGSEGQIQSQSEQVAPSQSEDMDDKGQMPAWMIESAQAAKDYVTGIDNGQYAQSWTKGDQLFQHTISQNEWRQALESSRKPLGNMKSRTVRMQNPAWNPQGLPKGPYMVIEYDTSFDRAPQSVEVLTLRRGSDGKWRVLTYKVN